MAAEFDQEIKRRDTIAGWMEWQSISCAFLSSRQLLLDLK
jgi:hypothetical protein